MSRLQRLGLHDDTLTVRLLRLRRDAAARRPRWRYEQPPQTVRELLTDMELRHEGHFETPIYRTLYRTACTPDQEWQRGYLEKLRYKWRYRGNDTPHVMNWLGTRFALLLAYGIWYAALAYCLLCLWLIYATLGNR